MTSWSWMTENWKKNSNEIFSSHFQNQYITNQVKSIKNTPNIAAQQLTEIVLVWMDLILSHTRLLSLLAPSNISAIVIASGWGTDFSLTIPISFFLPKCLRSSNELWLCSPKPSKSWKYFLSYLPKNILSINAVNELGFSH